MSSQVLRRAYGPVVLMRIRCDPVTVSPAKVTSAVAGGCDRAVGSPIFLAGRSPCARRLRAPSPSLVTASLATASVGGHSSLVDCRRCRPRVPGPPALRHEPVHCHLGQTFQIRQSQLAPTFECLWSRYCTQFKSNKKITSSQQKFD